MQNEQMKQQQNRSCAERAKRKQKLENDEKRKSGRKTKAKCATKKKTRERRQRKEEKCLNLCCHRPFFPSLFSIRRRGERIIRVRSTKNYFN